MSIHVDERVISDIGKIPLGTISRSNMVYTPTGMNRVFNIKRMDYTGFFFKFILNNKAKFITSIKQPILTETGRKLAKDVKAGEKIKFETGFIFIDKIVILHGHCLMIYLESYDANKQYYLANGFLVIN
jgi:hypothetical protein